MNAVTVTRGTPSQMERFTREYCGTCARRCKVVEGNNLHVLAGGFVTCARYARAESDWEW